MLLQAAGTHQGDKFYIVMMKWAPGMLLLIVGWTHAQPVVFPNAHAHNDYEHNRPLLDALANGFVSVEADVYDVDGILYVYHSLPSIPDKERTLENLYLRPLAQRVKELGGVYPGYIGFFYLMIDIKGDANQTYLHLRNDLAPYAWMLSVVHDQRDDQGKPVKIFLSGNRPVQEVLGHDDQLMALDGRPEDLGKNIPPALMPVVSQNFRKFSRWKGKGPVKEKDRALLVAFITKAHGENKKVRLWATPDEPWVWEYLLSIGVDLINTDKLEELKKFLVDRSTGKE